MPYTGDEGILVLVDGTSNCGLLRVRLSLPPEWHFESAQRSNHNIISILLKEAAVSVVGEARSISILGDPEPGGAPRPPGKRQSSLSCRYQPERAALGRPPGGGLGLVI